MLANKIENEENKHGQPVLNKEFLTLERDKCGIQHTTEKSIDNSPSTEPCDTINNDITYEFGLQSLVFNIFAIVDESFERDTISDDQINLYLLLSSLPDLTLQDQMY